jgi:Ankyrin repeat
MTYKKTYQKYLYKLNQVNVQMGGNITNPTLKIPFISKIIEFASSNTNDANLYDNPKNIIKFSQLHKNWENAVINYSSHVWNGIMKYNGNIQRAMTLFLENNFYSGIEKLLELKIDPNGIVYKFESFNDEYDNQEIDHEKPYLYVAVEKNNYNIAKLLLDNNADPNKPYRQIIRNYGKNKYNNNDYYSDDEFYGGTRENKYEYHKKPLSKAVENKNGKIINLLLDPKYNLKLSFNLNDLENDNYDNDLLLDIMHLENLNIIKTILNKHKPDLNIVDPRAKGMLEYRFTNLLEQAIEKNDKDLVKLLIELKANFQEEYLEEILEKYSNNKDKKEIITIIKSPSQSHHHQHHQHHHQHHQHHHQHHQHHHQHHQPATSANLCI